MKLSLIASSVALGCILANALTPSQEAPSLRRLFAEGLGEVESGDPLRPFSGLVHLACDTLSPYVSENDHAILRRLQDGDLRALEALYREYRGVVYNLGLRLCGARTDAEDILQDTFLEVSRSARSYRAEGMLVSWIKRICVSKALMKLRRANRFVEETLEEDGASFVPLTAATHLSPQSDFEIERAFFQLGSTPRVVVWLHDVEGYTHEEIAELLGKTPSFSKSQLSRAHERMRGWLSESSGDSACGI